MITPLNLNLPLRILTVFSRDYSTPPPPPLFESLLRTVRMGASQPEALVPGVLPCWQSQTRPGRLAMVVGVRAGRVFFFLVVFFGFEGLGLRKWKSTYMHVGGGELLMLLSP